MSGWISRATGAVAGFFAAVGAFACGASSEIREIPEGALIVDVRPAADFQGGHFPGALSLPLDELGGRIAELGERDRPIVVYCKSGRRSAVAKLELEKVGFANVVNGGGLKDVLRASPGSSAEK